MIPARQRTVFWLQNLVWISAKKNQPTDHHPNLCRHLALQQLYVNPFHCICVLFALGSIWEPALCFCTHPAAKSHTTQCLGLPVDSQAQGKENLCPPGEGRYRPRDLSHRADGTSMGWGNYLSATTVGNYWKTQTVAQLWRENQHIHLLSLLRVKGFSLCKHTERAITITR